MAGSGRATSIHRPSRARCEIEERSCRCGCGKTFLLEMKNRARKFAVDCPNAPERRALSLKRYEAQQKARKRGQATGGKGSGRAPAMDSHRTVKVCGLCGNLPERRPLEGCPRCHFPAGPPAPIVVVNRVDVD